MKTTDLAPFLEARLARRVRVRLDDSLEALPHDVSERLRVARAQALLRARRPGSKAGTRRAAREDGAPSWPWRLASALPAVLLLVGLWGIGEWVDWEQIGALADVELALLNDELPVDAYADPGFAEFLRSGVTDRGALSDRPTMTSPAPNDLAPESGLGDGA